MCSSALFSRYYLEIKKNISSQLLDGQEQCSLLKVQYKQNQKKEMSFAMVYSRKSWTLHVMY